MNIYRNKRRDAMSTGINGRHYRSFTSGRILCEEHTITVIGTKIMTAQEKFNFIKTGPTGLSTICMRCEPLNAPEVKAL